ncbi:acyltransferase [Rhodococcus fascians]|uniref:acyltransferase n=1 Tax=Rhodococcoides fascians TaxID=1828 RepID=UPI0024B85A31|nr:acyltransferase [Rhodococcus fascians]MDJ0002921.1 acyltransferase [Rhodococcus fascians]
MPSLRGSYYRLKAVWVLGVHGVRSTTARFEGRSPVFRIKGDFTIGRNFSTRTLSTRPSIVVSPGAKLDIGDKVFLNQGVTIWASKSISIGNRVLIGDLACLYDTNAHEVVPGEGIKVAAVVIEDDVWIGRDALILPGVTLGRGCVVAAKSVVTKSFPSGTVVAGSPASPIRSFALPEEYRRR